MASRLRHLCGSANNITIRNPGASQRTIANTEAFLNPLRVGCPADSDLQRMAEHPIESRDAEVSEHLTYCSPCFNRYMEILADLKRKGG